MLHVWKWSKFLFTRLKIWQQKFHKFVKNVNYLRSIIAIYSQVSTDTRGGGRGGYEMTQLYLVSPADEVKVVPVEEFTDDVRAERKRHPTVVLPPALHVLVRVRPQQVTQET